MEKFRRPLCSSDVDTRRGAGSGVDRRAPPAPSPGGRVFQNHAAAGPHGVGGRGMASFSPTLSQASSTLLTPRQPQHQQHQHQHKQPHGGGFSMFGGKAHSTPASSIYSSGGSRIDQRPPPALSPPTKNTSRTTAVAGFPNGEPTGGGGGLPRFKTLAQTLREQEEKEEEEEGDEEASQRHGGGGGGGGGGGRGSSCVDTHRPTISGRGTVSPPLPSPSPSGSLLHTTTARHGPRSSTVCGSRGGTVGGRHSFATPPPRNGSSYLATTSGPPSSAAPPRKRPRPAASAPASAAGRPASPPPRPQLTPTAVSSSAGEAQSGGGGSGGTPTTRTWGSLADGGRGGGRQRHASPRPTARMGGGAGLSSTRGGNSTSPRPVKSPRGQVGGSRGSSPRSQQQKQQPPTPPTPRRYKLADFAGADDVLYNPGDLTRFGSRGSSKVWFGFSCPAGSKFNFVLFSTSPAPGYVVLLFRVPFVGRCPEGLAV